MKKILFLIALALVALRGSSAQVDEMKAMATAQQFATTLIGHGNHRAPAVGNSVYLVHTEKNRHDASKALFYIFNSEDSYFIVSGDDRAHDVLAYGDSPIDMNNLPDGMLYWLDCYKQDLEYLQAHPEIMPEKRSMRAPIRGAVTPSVEPLLTAMWDQSAPYYYQCPVSNEQYCLTGCAATSMSMICYYWKYPQEITTPIAAYTTGSLHMYLEALPPTTFDYDNMRDRYWGNNYSQAQANAVAKLMRYVGQAEHMDYTPSASGVSSWDIARAIKTLGFDSDATMVYKDDYTDDEWALMIQDELLMGRPLEYCGFSASSGHAFNVDGYDADRDMYHINWGWSGSANCYCVLNAFRGGGANYSHGQLTIIGLEPPATSPTIKVRSHRVIMSGIAEKQTRKSFTVKGSLLTNGVTVTLNDNSGAFHIDVNQISLGELVNGKRVNVTYRPEFSGKHIATVTLSSPGAEDVIITLTGTAILETYEPQLLEAVNESSHSFNVQWNDGTPAKNVSHYRLEMAPVPYSDSKLTQDFKTFTATSTMDISSKLDELTGTPGWTGNRVYTGDGYIRLGSSSNKGWLKTPAMDMRDNNGVVTVKVTAKNAGSSGESLMQISCGNADTTVVTSAETKQFCVILPCDASEDATIKIGSRINGQRVLVYDLEVLAGDDYTPIDFSKATYFDNITGNAYRVEQITPGSYALRLQATYVDGTVSPWSNRVDAHLNWPLGDVNRDGEVNIADTNTIIAVILGHINSHNTFVACDLNGDGEVNISDINALNIIVLKGGE